MPQPEMTKPSVPETAMATPIAAEVPTAACMVAPNATSVGTLSDPPPIPISAEI